MQISIFGLGYVGVVAAACLASKGHRICGVDVQLGKVDAINRGLSPITEPGLDALVTSVVASGALTATDDVPASLNQTDVSIICVGTPSLPSGALDLSHVKTVAGRIREALLGMDKPCHHLIFRSTMVPGSTRQICETYFEDLIAAGRVRVYLHPEFLREGTSVHDFHEPSLSVIGVAEPGHSVEAIGELLPPQTETVVYEEAELLKYACNSFHAAKVAFANEIGRLGKSLDVDGARVMEMLCRDRVLNISTYYMRPGNPFGGSCLPKDVSALRAFAGARGLNLPLIESLLPSNDCQLEHLSELVEKRPEREVVILGLAFKASTDDLRGSSMVAMASRLSERGYKVRIFDPWLHPERLLGVNLQLASSAIPQLETMLKSELQEAIGRSGLILAFSKCAPLEELRRFVTSSHHVVDVNGWPQLRELPGTYEGICWR